MKKETWIAIKEYIDAKVADSIEDDLHSSVRVHRAEEKVNQILEEEKTSNERQVDEEA